MELSPDLEQRLRELLRVFLEENAKINLSALRTEEACWIGNILDSLAFLEISAKLAASRTQLSLLDIGTGGGFPLLPLAMALPEWRLTGADAVGKKIRAVETMAKTLGLPNVRVVAGRTEELGRMPEHREQYDIVTARAVAELSVLLEYCAPFAKIGGHVVLWKSTHIEEELAKSVRAQEFLHCPLTMTHRYTLPGDFGERQLLVFTKKAAVGKEFPRPVGMAKKKPL